MYSKYLFALPIRGKTAAVVAQAFLDNVIGQGGAIMAIHSDNGKEVKNNLKKLQCCEYKMQQSYRETKRKHNESQTIRRIKMIETLTTKRTM